MPASESAAISVEGVGKMYKLFARPSDKVLDAFNLQRLLFWRKHSYQEFWALRDLYLTVAKGERLGIVGRNGAGKSTLLKIITGSVQSTEGHVHVRGSVQALMELGTGFHPEFTGRQNIRASLAYQGLSPARVKAAEEDIIDFAELGSFIDQPIKTYSAGMYARLAFSTATAVEPDILIIDEVLGAGDAYFAAKCLDRMRQLTEQSGATVLFVSHDLASVQQMCSRAIWIDRGQMIADGTPLDITKAYYASIIEQEERRLRTRNARKGAKTPMLDAPTFVELIGRLVTDNLTLPQRQHPVKSITLRNSAGFELTVEPGAPMDNDAAQSAFLYTDPQYMNWSIPCVVRGSRVRCFEDVGGQYLHAPFVFRVPGEHWQPDQLTLEIEHAASAGEAIAVQVYADDTYQTLGHLTPADNEWRREAWGIHAVSKAVALPAESRRANPLTGPNIDTGNGILVRASTDKYHTEWCDLLDMRFLDEWGESKVMFRPHERIDVQVRAQVYKDLPVCGFEFRSTR